MKNKNRCDNCKALFHVGQTVYDLDTYLFCEDCAVSDNIEDLCRQYPYED